MRPEVQELLSAKAWLDLRKMEDNIQSHGDPRELRALGCAFLYTGCVWKALRVFRACRDRLHGRARAAALVDGACALSLMGDHKEALKWLGDYYSMDERPYDGPALECEAYCMWQLGYPWETVDAAYQRAAEAFAGSPQRVSRLTIDRIQMLIQAGQIEDAESLIEQVSDRVEVAGHVLGCRARVAEARGDMNGARDLAIEAIAILHSTVDPLGNNLREIGRLYVLLGRVTLPPESLAFIGAAKAAAMTLRFPSLYDEASQLEKGVRQCESW